MPLMEDDGDSFVCTWSVREDGGLGRCTLNR